MCLLRFYFDVLSSVLFLVTISSFVSAADQIELDQGRLFGLEIGEHTLVEDVPLGASGVFTFDLERFSILNPDSLVVEGTADGDRALPPSELVLLKGSVVGEDDDSLVFLSVGRFGVQGFVSRHEELWSISTGPYVGLLGPNQPIWVTSSAELSDLPPSVCQVDPNDPVWQPPVEDAAEMEPSLHSVARGVACELAVIAVDSDYEFTANLFGGNTAAAADYAMTLLAGVSTVYERDVRVALSVGYLRVWGDDVDPYGSPNEDLEGFLNKVRNVWRSTMSSQSRVVVQGLSGRNLGGGVAWVNTLCSTAWGYGVSANLGGSFPMPIGDHLGGNWDLMVVAHEMGHNFGTGHTHDSYDPTIDDCGNGDCSSAWGGTIMSYCYGCPGGMANLVMAFHPRVQEVIEATVAAQSCFTFLPGGVSAIEDRAETIVDASATIDVLLNDIQSSCGIPSITGVQGTSDAGGTVTVIPGNPHEHILYSPPSGFSGEDSFTYTIDDAMAGVVTIGVHTFRPADNPVDPQPGVRAAYYWLPSVVILPDFDSLTPVFEFIVPDINFQPTAGDFGSSGFINDVGAVYTGFMQVPFPGLYTIELESDDGSRLYIGDDLLIDNDGIHTMQKQTCVVGLYPGKHRIRVEYFEATGEAGLIVRRGTVGMTPVAIPPSSWFYSETPPCAVDLTGDGQIDFFDVQQFLNDFAAQTSGADWNDDGVLNFFDVQSFLGDFAAGCP